MAHFKELSTLSRGEVTVDLDSISVLEKLTQERFGQIVAVTLSNGDKYELIGDNLYDELADYLVTKTA